MAVSLRRFGIDLVVRMTNGISDRSRLNAQLAGALVEARGHDWREALAAYATAGTSSS